jgi:DNA primase
VRLLSRYTTRVLVNFDPDTAGANAAEKSLALLTEEDFEVKIVTLEGGLDPDRYIRERGAKEYMAALRGARRHQDYLIERARQLFPPRTPENKIKALNYLLPHIRRIPNPIGRNEFATDAAQKLDIDSALVREELKQAASKRRDFIATPASSPLTRAEQILLQAFSSPHHSETYRLAEGAYLAHEGDFAKMRSDVHAMVNCLRARPDNADPMQCLADQAQRQLLAGIFVSVHGAEPEVAHVEEAIMTVRRISLEQEQRALRSSIQEAERQGRAEDVVTLSRQSQAITHRLRSLD